MVFLTFTQLKGVFLTPLQVAPLGGGLSPLLAQLLTALVIGILTTFGLQVLLANLGVALGLSALSQRLSVAVDAAAPVDPGNANQSGRGVAGKVRAGGFLSVNLVLFLACFMAAKFSQVSGLMTGAIAGLTIWSAYLLIVVWLSTRTLNAVATFLLDQATGGLRRMVSAIKTALTTSPEAPVTAAQVRESVHQEVQAALQSTELREQMAEQLQRLTYSVPSATVLPEQAWQPIHDFLVEAKPKHLSSKRLNRKLKTLLPTVQEQLPEGAILAIPVETWAAILEQRQDLSGKKQRRVLQQIATAWEDLTAADPSEATAADSTAADEAEVADQRWQLAQSAAETVLKQTLTQLPKMLQDKADLPSGVGLASLALSKALPALLDTEVDNPLQALSLEAPEVQHYLDHLREETPANLAQLGQASLDQAEQLRDWAMQPIAQVQQGVDSRITALKQQARDQAEATRRVAAQAAWWLFATASTGAISAAAAGALATEVHWP